MGIISFESVYFACNQLAAEGIYPTRELVRERLGGGSPNIIAPILKRWKDEHPKDVAIAPAVPIPGRLKDMAEQFLQRWWGEAVNIADDSLESNQIIVLVSENESLRQQLEDYKKLQGFIEGQDNLASQLMTEIQKLTLENLALKEGIAPEQINVVNELHQQLSEKEAELDNLALKTNIFEKQAQELHQQIKVFENNIQVLTSQKQELEQECSNLRIQNATLSIKDEEINQLKAQVKKLESDVPRRKLTPIEVDEPPQLAQQNVQLLAEIEQLKATIDQQEKALYLASLSLDKDIKDIVQDTKNTNVQNVLVQPAVPTPKDTQDTENTNVQNVQISRSELNVSDLSPGMWVQLAPGATLKPKQEVRPGNFFCIKSIGRKHARLTLDGTSEYELQNYRFSIIAVFEPGSGIQATAGNWVR